MTETTPKDARYEKETCLSDCPHLVFVRVQKLRLTNTTISRYRCGYYGDDRELIHVMARWPHRCAGCFAEGGSK